MIIIILLFFLLKVNSSIDIFMGSRNSKLKLLSHLYMPKGSNQIIYNEKLQEKESPLLIVLGPAGTGKTLFACMNAIMCLKRGEVEKIVITRPLVSVENEDIGYLPGNMVLKMDPWTRPIIDIFNEFYSLSDIQNLIKNGVIEISPLAYMRGRTFHRTYLLADEMQNSSPNQMKMLTTRIGNDSKFVIMGDIDQSDLNIKDGLYDFVEKYEKYKDNEKKKRMCIIKMENKDIQRSKVVSDVLEIYKGKELEIYKGKEEIMNKRILYDKKEMDIQKLRLWGREYPHK